MPRFTSTEASLYNGISQQSAELRLPSQVTDVENAKLTVAEGIERRPPFEFQSELSQVSFSTDSLTHPIYQDKDVAYLFVIGGDGSNIDDTAFALNNDGANNQHIVRYPGSTNDYVTTVDSNGDFIPKEALQLTTILGSTFVCNKNVTPVMDTTVTPDIVASGYLWVKNGVQEVDRSVTVAGVKHTHVKIPDNDSKLIVDYFDTEINAQAGFSATRISDSILHIIPDVDAPFTLVAEDSYSDTTMSVSLSLGTKIEDLPPSAADEQKMVILPESNTELEYYLQYDEDTKVWSEISAPGKATGFDAETMPHRFVQYTDDGAGTITGTPFKVYFDCEEIDWAPRSSGGGEDPEVLPSFIGNKITDTFFFKNRLGFIAGDSVILSGVDDLFNFWPTTVQEVLDDDPIDITVSSTRNIELSHVATFPDSLILIGDREQFSLGSGNKAFTPENVTIEPTTTYSASQSVPPVTMGSTMFFVAPQSEHAALREYSVQPDTLVTDAADVTGHVPTLLPNRIKQLIPEPNLEYIFLVDDLPYDDEGNLIHVYKFFWQGNEKVQSSWQKWRVWFNPIGGMVFNGVLWMLGTEKAFGEDTTVLTTANLSDEPPVELDDLDEPYKLTRPNIDRELAIDVVGEPIVNGKFLTIQVQQEAYEYFDFLNVTPVLVDRVSGQVFEYLSRYISNGMYYLVFCVPYPPSSLGDLECLTLGTYTVGGCEPFNPVPIVSSDVHYRIHARDTSWPPNVTLSNVAQLNIVSDTSNQSQVLILFHTTKTLLNNRKAYIDWSSSSSAETSTSSRALGFFDGHIEGDDAIFINNASVSLELLLLSRAVSDDGRYQDTAVIPDLSSFGENITLALRTNDSWQVHALTVQLYDLQIRELNDDIAHTFDFSGTIVETGTDGDSSFGDIS